MAGSTIDHMVALTLFLAALLLFIGLFNQTIQTAVLYQRHAVIAAKCTDLLDNVLLSPGYPTYWGSSNSTPSSFGLQDPEFMQYQLSPFSLMHLNSLTGSPIYYPNTGQTYSNITMGFGNFLFVPYSEVLNYSTVSMLLGINNTYGFQMMIVPIVNVSISELHSSNPLNLSVNVAGKGFPLANANLTYCFMTALLQGGGSYPTCTTSYGTANTDEKGMTFLSFPAVTDPNTSYSLTVYAHIRGLTGMGYCQRVSSAQQYVVPLIEDFDARTVILAHSYDVNASGQPKADISYNATFVLLAEDFTLREMPIVNSTGIIGNVQPYGELTIPTNNPGILVITYKKSPTEGGIVLMPWGVSAMAFQVTFGAGMSGKEWVATDTRDVTVNNVAYQASLALWDLQGYQVKG